MDNDFTGNSGPLSLAERARLGLLEPELEVSEIAELEQPADRAARKALRVAINKAITYGDLVTEPPVYRPWQRTVLEQVGGFLDRNPNWDSKRLVTKSGETRIILVDREIYRTWRAQCPATLLSPLSQIHKWLGATPAVETIPPAKPSLSLPEKRQRQDALSHAISAAIAVLSPSGGPLPQPKVLFEYLRTSDKTKTVIDSSKEQLTWYSAETGRKQTATIANLKRRLDRWKD